MKKKLWRKLSLLLRKLLRLPPPPIPSGELSSSLPEIPASVFQILSNSNGQVSIQSEVRWVHFQSESSWCGPTNPTPESVSTPPQISNDPWQNSLPPELRQSFQTNVQSSETSNVEPALASISLGSVNAAALVDVASIACATLTLPLYGILG